MANKKIATSYKGRRCKYEACVRVLSIYNHNVYCNIHVNKMSLESLWKDIKKPKIA